MTPFLIWLQHTSVAHTISDSLPLTAVLSAVHLLGLTTVLGSALVSHLRMLGVLFPDRPVAEIAGPTGRALLGGLAVSVVTGLLLFAPRAEQAMANSTFQLKMLLLVAAVTVHVLWQRRVVRRVVPGRLLAAVGAAGLGLWLSVALAGCAFILVE